MIIKHNRLYNINVGIEDEFYSVHKCLENKYHLYLFGDNSIRIGTGGQATIRGTENSKGIRTKVFPSMSKESFFSDEKFEEQFKMIEEDLNEALEICITHNLVLVFPAAGLGTGLSRLPECAPNIFKALCELLVKHFGIGTTRIKNNEYKLSFIE